MCDYDETNVETSYVGQGEVKLIAGGGKIYTDIAARFVRSERDLDSIISSDYNPEIVKNIIQSGHLAATEFDLFIFGVSGYSRVCEVQLVRKRLASYLIKSGRAELNGKRAYKVTIPTNIAQAEVTYRLPYSGSVKTLIDPITGQRTIEHSPDVEIYLNPEVLNDMIACWYNGCLEQGFKEEDLRYMKPQATQWQGIIGINAHGLRDWLKIRMCKNAQAEIRDLATKMFKLAKEAAPELMEGAGPSCVHYGYCPEGKYQHPDCKGKIYTKEEALSILKSHRKADENIRNFANGFCTAFLESNSTEDTYNQIVSSIDDTSSDYGSE